MASCTCSSFQNSKKVTNRHTFVFVISLRNIIIQIFPKEIAFFHTTFVYLQNILVAALDNPRLLCGFSRPLSAGEMRKVRRTRIAFILTEMRAKNVGKTQRVNCFEIQF